MSLGIVLSDTIVSTVEVGVAVYNEILGDPASDPAIVGNNRNGAKRTRRRVPQSLVRRVAQTLPLKTEARLKIPITRFQEEYGISVNNNGKYSVSPFEDTSWLYEEEGNLNSSYRTHRFTPNPYPKDFIQRWELRPPGSGQRRGEDDGEDPDSGLDSISCVTKNSEVAEERVAALETELASLKAMMASIALAQMQPAATSTPTTDKTASRTPQAGPPPPPPPPPPMPPTNFKPTVPPSAKSKPLPEIREDKVAAPNMNDMLKNVGKQKSLLKSVEKSPGGTPMRRQPKPCNPQDPNTVLANALRQKFANTPTTMNDSTDREASFNDSMTN